MENLAEIEAVEAEDGAEYEAVNAVPLATGRPYITAPVKRPRAWGKIGLGIVIGFWVSYLVVAFLAPSLVPLTWVAR